MARGLLDEGIEAMSSLLQQWRQRHRHRVSFWLHIVGIPLAVGGGILALVQLGQGRWDLWWRPVALIAAGYVLQWLGHRLEGNDMGEVILVKKWLHRPYVSVSPRYKGDRDAS